MRLRRAAQLRAIASKLFIFVVAIFVAASCTKDLAAQPSGNERGSRGERERDHFFQAIRDVHRIRMHDRDLVEVLLRYDNVPKEIGLSDDNRKEIRVLISDSMKATFELRKELSEKAASRDEMVAKILETQKPFDEKIDAILHDEKEVDFDRLLGIYIQDRKFRAATNTEVANRLGLDEKELKALRTYRSEVWEKLMDENREKMGDLIREGKREKIPKLFQQAEDQMNDALAVKLSLEQRHTLEQLKGEKFEFPENPIEFRGPPRGGRPGESKKSSESKKCCNAELANNKV